jgi:hypothetical protein
MGAYSATASKSGVNTATTTMFNIWSTAGTGYITTIIVSTPVAPTTIPDLYVVRSTARGTATTSATGNAFDPNDAAGAIVLDSVWSAAPTVGAVTSALVRLPLALASGSTFYYTADVLNAPWIRTTNGLAIVNGNATGATTGTFVCTAVWRE